MRPRQGAVRAHRLWPRRPRHTPVAAILLTNGDLDHVLGLLCLRESQPLVIYATHEVRRGFVEGNSVYRTVEVLNGFRPKLPVRALKVDVPEATATPAAAAALKEALLSVPGITRDKLKAVFA